MKSWNSAFNAQGSRGIIVAVQVGTVKIYLAAVQALSIKESHGETQKTIMLSYRNLLYWIKKSKKEYNKATCKYTIHDALDYSQAIVQWNRKTKRMPLGQQNTQASMALHVLWYWKYILTVRMYYCKHVSLMQLQSHMKENSTTTLLKTTHSLSKTMMKIHSTNSQGSIVKEVSKTD
jgi:hypothetical protein